MKNGQPPLDLSRNENLFGTNPALVRILQNLDPGSISLYPTEEAEPIQEAALERWRLPSRENVLVGNGSNDLLGAALGALVLPGERVSFPYPTFELLSTLVLRAKALPCPVGSSLDPHLDVSALEATSPRLIYVASPNNPTGTVFNPEGIRRLLSTTQAILLLDEAYVEFTGDEETFLKEIRSGNDRILLLRTLSKAHGLAGLRVGILLGSPTLLEKVRSFLSPYRVNALAEVVGAEALRDRSFVPSVAKKVKREREFLAGELTSRGFRVSPSQANFLWVQPPMDPHVLFEGLLRRGILLRMFPGFLRITVAPRRSLLRLLREIDRILEEVR